MPMEELSTDATDQTDTSPEGRGGCICCGLRMDVMGCISLMR